MARSSIATDIFEISRRLPWWFGVLLAAASYFSVPFALLMIPVAETPVTVPLATTFELAITVILRYVFPGLFLLGAVASIVDKLSARSALRKTRSGGKYSAGAFTAVSWRQFEQLTAAYFREQGYYVFDTQAGPDGGVDLKASKDGQNFLVQCKHWKARKVSVQVVRELFGVMAAKGSDGAFVVASGDFTDEAKRFVQGRNIKLINGRDILSGRVASFEPIPDPSYQPLTSCPICSSEMVLRTAKKGTFAGNVFYGCSQYPRCRGIRQINPA
ncbi:restriction endonuclease [Aliidiomarina sp. Khilg15.8]